MKTLEKIRDDITAQFEKEHDYPFKLRVTERILDYRAFILEQQAKRKFFDRNAVQSFLVPLRKVTTSGSSSILTTDCVIMEAPDFPRIINIMRFPFDYVGFKDGSPAFAYGRPDQVAYHLANPSYKGVGFYDFFDSTLRVYAKKRVDNIRVDGFLYDPREASKYLDPHNLYPCYNDETPFPFSPKSLGDLTRMVIQSFAGENLIAEEVSDEKPNNN